VENIIANIRSLIVDKHGNYVIQFIILMNNKNYNYKIFSILVSNENFLFYGKEQYSSNVIEKVSEECFNIIFIIYSA